jgi:hypothetical protein
MAFSLVQAGLLLFVGSNFVKCQLILAVGPERALGGAGVYRLDDGTILMSNPIFQFFWMLPCLVPGAVCFWLAIRVANRKQ